MTSRAGQWLVQALYKTAYAALLAPVAISVLGAFQGESEGGGERVMSEVKETGCKP